MRRYRYQHSHLPKKIKLYLKYLVFLFLFNFAYRVLFLVLNKKHITDLNSSFIGEGLRLGALFDLRLAALMTLPLLLFLIIPFVDLLRRKFFRLILFISLSILFVTNQILYFSDFGYFVYLGSRINSSVLSFLETPWISMQMVWESYPVVWGALGLVLLALIHHVFLSRMIREYIFQTQILSLKVRFGAGLLIFLIFAVSIYGKVGYYPLRWSEAYFSGNHFISQFTLNPILNIADTFKYKKKNYDLDAVKGSYPLMSEVLGVRNPDLKNLNFIREVQAQGSRKFLNIIVVMMESLALNKTSLSGNPLDPTPNLKALAKESLVFTNTFTPTESTARGVFASVTANADVTIGKSSSRNPFIVNQHSVVNHLKNYDKFYFLGGSANWGNIRGLWSNNVDGIKIFEEGSYSSTRIDVWGISDISLFNEAKKVLDQQKKNFFAFIQTSGFHRPYTIPEVNEGFKVLSPGLEKVQKYGFISEAEFNSMRLQDHALGVFINRLKESPYYKDTIVVIYGDHGLPSTTSEHTSLGLISHNLVNHQVPMVIHHKGGIEPQVIDTVVSQLDAMPSVLSYIGIPYKIRTFGTSIIPNLEEKKLKGHAFLYSWYSNPPKYGIVDNQYYLKAQSGQYWLYDYLSSTPNVDISSKKPKLYEKYKELADGYLNTGRYLLYHNKKLPIE